MAINPATSRRMLDAYPHLTPISADDAFLRWLAYVYDPGSPLITAHPDFRRRKEAASEITGHQYRPEDIEVIKMFLREVVKTREWRIICVIEYLFDENEGLLYDSIDKSKGVKDADIITAAEKKDKLKKQMIEMIAELPKLKQAFFGGDEDLEEPVFKPKTPENMAGKKR